MSKKTTYIHAENNNKILSSNEVRLYVPPEPEKMKVLIWGKELCNMAEWNDFLNCVEEKTKENNQLKQQLVEKDTRIAELEDKDWFEANIKQLEEQNNRLIGKLKDKDEQLAEKDKEIERLKNLFKLNNEVVINQGKEIFDLRVQVLQQKQNQTQLAIQELEKVKDTLKHFCNIHSDEYYGVKAEVKGIELDVCESIDYQIRELKGE